MTDWNFYPVYMDDNSVQWSMDFEKLQRNVIEGMRQREEEATLHVVINYLRDQGYLVVEPRGVE